MGLFDFLKKKSRSSNSYDLKDLAKSQYSDLPRKYTIAGAEYDIDNPADISRLPIINVTFMIDGFEYGMDSILFDHGSQAYKVNKEVSRAAIEKHYQYRNNGICHKSKRELELDKKWAVSETEKAERKQQIESFQAEDMYQFVDIPFCWHQIKSLRHTDGIAWCTLNTSNQVIARHYIDQLNDLIIDAHGYVTGVSNLFIDFYQLDFGYPVPALPDSMANTRIECTPFTKSGKVSKYPVVLRFSSSRTTKYADGSPHYFHPIVGEIKILKDGNIGNASVTFYPDYTRFDFRLYGLSLVLKKVSTIEGVIFDFDKEKECNL